MDALRQDALELIESNRFEVLWHHILDRGHLVSEEEIRSAFYFGYYGPSRTTPSRYSIQSLDAGSGTTLVVVFEVQRVPGGKFLLIVTAYHREGP